MSVGRDYPRLTVEEFGRHLLSSNDLDPVYCALYTMLEGEILSQAALNRWLLAYSCLYHTGAASYLSEFEGEAFFAALLTAAKNEEPTPLGERWPRGHERRHWRGAQAINSATELWGRYGAHPERFVTYVTWGTEPPSTLAESFPHIAGRVREHRGFGGWIAFKLADMIDRLGLRKVEFVYNNVVIYDDPVKAAEILVRQKHGYPAGVKVKPEAVKGVFEYLEEHFNDFSAPPLHDRPVGLQEVESILCKWKSSQNGHYPLYNDIREIRSGLAPWARVSEVASFFLAAMPPLPAEAAA